MMARQPLELILAASRPALVGCTTPRTVRLEGDHLLREPLVQLAAAGLELEA